MIFWAKSKDGELILKSNLFGHIDNNKLMNASLKGLHPKVEPYAVSMGVDIILQEQIHKAVSLIFKYAVEVAAFKVGTKQQSLIIRGRLG